MSKNEENNSHLFNKNNSTQNLQISSHQKYKSTNFLSDSPSTLITVQMHSLNSNQNSKSNEKNNLENKSTKNLYNPKNISYKNNNIDENEKIIKKNEEEINLGNQFPNQIKINSNTNDSDKNLKKDINHSYSSSRPELDQNSLKNINNFRMKLSKMSEKYISNTPKQITSVYSAIGENQILDQSNILVKKNLRLGTQKSKNSPNIRDRKNENKNRNIRTENNNKNEYVKYVNNDKYNINGNNILNMTQNYGQSKFVLSQSKSFTKVEKKNSIIGLSTPINNNSKDNINKGINNFNYINYNNYKNNCNKKKELTVLTKNNNTFRNNKKIENSNNINSFACQNISTSPNSNHAKCYINNISKNNYSRKNIDGNQNKTQTNNANRSKNKSNDGSKNNNQSKTNISNNINTNINHNSNKNIYFMKPIQHKKKGSFGKNHEISKANKDNTTNQSSVRSKDKKDNFKNTLDSSFLSDVFNKNIENPEELHFFYIKILQNGKDISKKFEIDNT